MSDKIKLNEEELEELQKREQLARQYQLTAEAVRLQARLFLNNTLTSKGLDVSDNFNIDLDTGEVTKVEQEEKEEK